MDGAQALAILTRYTPELTVGDRTALLAEHTVTRRVGGLDLTLPDPYAAAVAHLMHPGTIKSRSEGGVSETYIEPTQAAAYLQVQSDTLRASWPAADGTTRALDLTITVEGW